MTIFDVLIFLKNSLQAADRKEDFYRVLELESEYLEMQRKIKELEGKNYIQPWADSALGEFTVHLQLLGFVFAGMSIFISSTSLAESLLDDPVNKWLVAVIFFLILLNSIILLFTIRNHRDTLWNRKEGTPDAFKSNRDNNYRKIVTVVTLVIFTSIAFLFMNVLFWNLKPGL